MRVSLLAGMRDGANGVPLCRRALRWGTIETIFFTIDEFMLAFLALLS
jgi:hypothetical protein